MIERRRARAGYCSEQAGITTWHTFSAGAHYDPDNLSCGPVIGCDEHAVAPRAGFDWHAHRGVALVSWILAGTLRHEGSQGPALLVSTGSLLVQYTGDGIRHRETNASDHEPLRVLQLTLLVDAPACTIVLDPPAAVAGGITVTIGGELPRRGFVLDIEPVPVVVAF